MSNEYKMYTAYKFCAQNTWNYFIYNIKQMQSQYASLQESACTSAATCGTESIKTGGWDFDNANSDHKKFPLCTAKSHFKLHAGT
jgi:hypothetical protein